MLPTPASLSARDLNLAYRSTSRSSSAVRSLGANSHQPHLPILPDCTLLSSKPAIRTLLSRKQFELVLIREQPEPSRCRCACEDALARVSMHLKIFRINLIPIRNNTRSSVMLLSLRISIDVHSGCYIWTWARKPRKIPVC